MSNILNIGKSALNAAQIGIATTGHNIANASTPGYSRQVIVQAAAEAQNFGYGFVGQGTNIVGVQRVYNDTLAKQLLVTTSSSNASSAYYSQISEINNLLSDSDAGLNPVISQFFSSVSAAAANPSDLATRQTMLSSAQSMVDRFATINNRLDEIRNTLNTQIESSVSVINSYAKQIADLNVTIDKALSSTGNPPNDLMDQRDLLVSKLSEQIKTSVIKQGDGTYNIFVGNGMPLVVGKESYQLYTQTSYTDTNRTEIAYGNPDDPKIISSDSLPGGILGGILQFRSETLDAVQNQIGQLATTIATQFNDIHKTGQGLTGTTNKDFFTIGAPVSTSSSLNDDGNKIATVTITDASALTSSNYRVLYTGGQYVVTRLSDKHTFDPIDPADMPFEEDGIQIALSTSSPTEGDEYLIKPTQYAASGLGLNITNVEEIALSGTGTLAGENNNEVGLTLAALQNKGNVSMIGSTTSRTYAQAFALMVSGVGTKTNELSITSKADASALESATAAMQSESGVNLDEEAADLLRYQQAYQAAGKMMQIASQLFEILLQMGQ